MTTKVQAGNTVRLLCSFFDTEGELVDPSFITIVFYDYKYNKTFEQDLDAQYRIATGTYFFDFQTDYEEKRYIYEFIGLIEGFRSVKRAEFLTAFI